MNKNKRFVWKTQGVANKQNIISGKDWRFTVLTSRLIRMEFSDFGEYEDRATQIVFYRDFPNCTYETHRQGTTLFVDTEHLHLSFDEAVGKESLQIHLKTLGASWRYGQKLPPQLKGTTRTLDEADGSVKLEDGLCSRAGYTLMDDSGRLVLSEDGWFDRKKPEEDLYFFGYGHDYIACVQDFYRLTGAPSLLPDYALGNWWSRFHKYTQQEYCGLMERFEKEKLPFSVAVVDMDWHIVKIPEECKNTGAQFDNGWTGYSWNRELFPDYKAFLRFLKDHNLKTALNLHPAQGVGCHEDMYPRMAEACGIDPQSKKRVKLDLLNPEFMEHYFDVLHHPYEQDGVNFWGMDGQQGTDYWWIHDEEHPESPLEQMDPLWLLNHLHILDISRNGKRPMFFSRYAGLGSHRYPVGFSGDTIVTWDSLQFQPYFTATASNAGYCWWSHDIGGHMFGYKDDELTVRWMQFGVFSPINRLHSDADPFRGKEPWNLSFEAEKIAGDYLRLRHRLFPYIYTMNYRTHHQLLPLIQPMYYLYPEMDEAYEAKNQYFFGSELMVCPITEKNDPVSLRGKTKVWFPEGQWIDFFNGLVYTGNQIQTIHRPLSQMPVFAKAGAIVPMQNDTGTNTLGRQENMTVYVFPGADNHFVMTEDLGDGDDADAVAYTSFELHWDKVAELSVSASGNLCILPEKRSWTFALRGFAENAAFTVTAGGEAVQAEIWYEKQTATWYVKMKAAVDAQIKLTVQNKNGLVSPNVHAKDLLFDLLLHAQMGYRAKQQLYRDGLNAFRNRLFGACTEQSHQTVKSAVAELLTLYEE